MRACALCGKSYTYSVARKKVMSKYNPTVRKKKRANLQWARLPNGKRIKACTKCIKKLYK